MRAGERTGDQNVDRIIQDLRDEIATLRRDLSQRVVRFDRDTNRLVVTTPDGKASVQVDVDDGEKSTPLRRDIDGRGMTIRNVKKIEAEEVSVSKGTVNVGRDVKLFADGARAHELSPVANGPLLVENDPTANPTFGAVTSTSVDTGALSADTATIGGATDYLEVESDGTIEFHGAATYWRDIDFPIVSRNTGTGRPTDATLGTSAGGTLLTAPTWAIGDFNQCETQELVHEYKEGSTLYWHIHLITNGLEVGNHYVRFRVTYSWQNIDGVLSTPIDLDSPDLLIPGGTADRTMLLFSIGNFTPAARIGGHVKARLSRIALAGAGTAPAANPFVEMLQLHVECDTLGSRQISSK